MTTYSEKKVNTELIYIYVSPKNLFSVLRGDSRYYIKVISVVTSKSHPF